MQNECRIKWRVASQMARAVKYMPTVQETQVQSLSWEDPLEEEMEAHSSILAWRIPWTEKPGKLWSIGLQSQTQLEWLSVHAHFPGIALVEVFISSLLISYNSFLPFPPYSFPHTPNFSVFQCTSNLILLFSNKNPLIVFCSHAMMFIISRQVFKQNFNLSLKLHFQLF